MNWWRAHHGLPFDPKLAVVALKAGAGRGEVLAVWVACLDYASQHEDRGSVWGLDAESIGVALDMDPEKVARIVANLHEKNMISGDDRLTAWNKRQPLRERERDDDSAERVAAFRERKRLQRLCNASNAHVTPVTPTNAQETPRGEERRGEEIRREEKRENALSAPSIPGWDEFRAKYPSHRFNEEPALRAYLSREGEHQAILAGLDVALKSQDWADAGGKFIPRASRFISDGMYLDLGRFKPRASRGLRVLSDEEIFRKV